MLKCIFSKINDCLDSSDKAVFVIKCRKDKYVIKIKKEDELLSSDFILYNNFINTSIIKPFITYLKKDRWFLIYKYKYIHWNHRWIYDINTFEKIKNFFYELNCNNLYLSNIYNSNSIILENYFIDKLYFNKNIFEKINNEFNNVFKYDEIINSLLSIELKLVVYNLEKKDNLIFREWKLCWIIDLAYWIDYIEWELLKIITTNNLDYWLCKIANINYNHVLFFLIREIHRGCIEFQHKYIEIIKYLKNG